MNNALEMIRDVLREDFLAFHEACFNHLHSDPFVYSWHTEAICYALQKVVTGETPQLVATVPPRHGKSLCTSVSLPAWLLGLDPALKVLVTSYGGDLASKHAKDFRSIVTSDWYKTLFPAMRLAVPGGNKADEQTTTKNGGRKAGSIGGGTTGFGAHYIIIDDLTKADDANSPNEREKVKDHYRQTLVSRFDDAKKARIIVIAQRLQEDDLPGYLLDTNTFEHLNLPAIAQRDEKIPLSEDTYHQRLKGEALWPEKYTLAHLEKLRLQMGNSAFSAQYLQDPTPEGGNRIRWEWFPTHNLISEPRTHWELVIQSWDTGTTALPTSDYSVGMTWGYRAKKWYLLDVVRKRLDFGDLKRKVIFEYRRWTADCVLIERAGSGHSLLQQLRDENSQMDCRPITPVLGKEQRVEAESARLETGNYLLPSESPFREELRRELAAFPNGKYDDQVDCMMQFVHFSASSRSYLPVARHPETGRPLRVFRPQRNTRQQAAADEVRRLYNECQENG